MNIVILDDYQDAVRKLKCASRLDAFPAKVYTNTVKGIGQLSVRLKDADVIALARRGDATFDMVYLGSTPDRLCEDLVGSWMALTASVARVEGIHPSIRAMLKSLSETVRHEVSAR